MSPGVPARFRDAAVAWRVALIAESYQRLLGTALVSAEGEALDTLWHAPDAIVAHGTEPDPLFFFGNAAALEAFGYPMESFVGLPSRLSAEAPVRDERQALLDRVRDSGFIADYAGVRIDASGGRFRIENAVVWNLVDASGAIHGQAARFVR